jgi:hypothetical protein
VKGKILGISGIGDLYSFISRNSVVINTRNPEVDRQYCPYRENSFDFVKIGQIIEPLKTPKKP